MSLESMNGLQEKNIAIERDAYIFEVTGIQPDSRYHIPAEETRQLVRGVQAEDNSAAEALIATRLIWVHDKFAQHSEVKKRYDVEMADILHIGCIATIEAARQVKADTAAIETVFQNVMPRQMEALLLEEKLLPTFSEKRRQRIYYARDRKECIAEEVEPIGSQQDVVSVTAQDRSEVVVEPEDLVLPGTARAVIAHAWESLTEDERYVMEARFGLGEFAEREAGSNRSSLIGPLTHREIAKIVGLSFQRVHQIEEEARVKLHTICRRQLGNPLLGC